MTDPEIPEEKNEQELNLFADQNPPEEDVPAVPDPSGGDASGGSALEAPAVPGHDPVFARDDAPVIAPPPPRKKPAPLQPGLVDPPRAGKTPFPQSAASAGGDASKPLPPLQPGQTLGQMLSAIRNARGMSIEEVALTTRIRMEYISELERDELLQQLPVVYVSAYVRKLAEVYGLSGADSGILLDKMHDETPDNAEKIPDKLFESVNEGALVNEGENKRIRNITIAIYVGLGIILLAIVWLIVLAVARYTRTPASGPAPAVSGVVQPAETPVSQTILLEESELDALVVPETPSMSVLKMSKTPAIRDTP